MRDDVKDEEIHQIISKDGLNFSNLKTCIKRSESFDGAVKLLRAAMRMSR